MVTTPSNAAEAITLAATGNRALAAAGQSDMVWGHASVRDPEGRGVWMKCSGWGFEEVDEQKIVLVSPEGKVLHGSGRRHLEYPIHTEIMAARGDVGAVVHSHSDAANAFSALDVPILPLNHAGSLFSYPDVARFTLTGGLISTSELGQALAEALPRPPARPPPPPAGVAQAVGAGGGHGRQAGRRLVRQPEAGRLGVPRPRRGIVPAASRRPPAAS